MPDAAPSGLPDALSFFLYVSAAVALLAALLRFAWESWEARQQDRGQQLR